MKAVDAVPLCIDLDGTLILTDSLQESMLRLLGKPLAFARAILALIRGKAAMKDVIAKAVPMDPAALPYRQELLDFLAKRKDEGQRILLVTASHRIVAEAVATHLGLFDGVMATEGRVNLGGRAKRKALVEAFGEKGYDYAGDHRKDLAVFASARRAILADPSRSLEKKTRALCAVEAVFRRERKPAKALIKGLRVHQWAKNALLFVPLVTAHKVRDLESLKFAGLSFLCLSLLASATYIINDLHDLAADRKHPRKRFRPFASGDLPIPGGLAISALLATLAIGLSLAYLPPLFSLSLGAYALLTLAYSFDLKRRLIVDAITLAALYTLRIFAGAAAISVPVSEWLLMFSLFFFLSLALLKRCIELDKTLGQKIPGRGYAPTDIDVLLSIGPASGMISVLVLALYVSSPAVQVLYRTPLALWFLCPLVIYWITRIWFLAKRGDVHHDPITFALTDLRSYIIVVLAGIVLLAATLDLKGLVLKI